MKTIISGLLCTFFPVLAIFAQQIGIQPSILEFHLSPGTVESQVVRISNFSDKKLSFEAYLNDWIRDSTGTHHYYKPDTLQQSCAKWVTLSKSLIEVEPGKTQELLVRLQAPQDTQALKQMKWAMLFLQSVAEQDSADRKNKNFNTKINELLRVGVHIYQTPPSITLMSAKAIDLKQVTGQKNTYDFYMQNTGKTMLQCKAHFALTDVATGKEFKTDKIEFPVFPEAKRKVQLTIPSSIPAGKYSALAILDIGEDLPLEAIERTIEVH